MADDYLAQKALEARPTSKPVSDILTMLRAIANPVEGQRLVDFHSHRLMSQSRRMSARWNETALGNAKLTCTCTCVSATALGALQMLSSFFE